MSEPAADGAVRLVALDAEGFRPYADDAVAVYAEAMRRGPEVAAQRRAMLLRHVTYERFRAVVALDPAGRLVGFGYTYPGRAGQWWHDSVYAALRSASGRTAARSWVSDSLEVVELHVLPYAQGQGIGRRLLVTLTEGVPERTVLLSTHDHDSRARRLYRSFGFVDLLTDYRFPGGMERFAVMGLRLRDA